MKKQTLTLLLVVLCATITFAQDTSPSNNESTIENQLVDAIDKSNSYKEFKVIEKSKLARLRANILDSISSLEENITSLHSEIDTQKNEIASLTQSLKTTNENLTVSKKKENGIEIFGTITEKSTYNTVMWSIIGLLLLALGFFVYKFKNSHSITKAARLKLAETEVEFEAHRQKKLEEQQQLRRKLQDEINKNRKVQ
ncbi:hypothetical protein G5B37_14995 [Rasiella rasia]|uniref:tRNA (Guanine-N1)-methyltransferase n=1 Tax=Rasiella rasia TaxID=2744027 RepID=A0A6G6GQS0_9FLAO|nr:hypothetical protein [Rasiella rasia]QIE60814.1 hypothetical protein G5B37_14995 [Rasiella rasia]